MPQLVSGISPSSVLLSSFTENINQGNKTKIPSQRKIAKIFIAKARTTTLLAGYSRNVFILK